MKKLLIPLAIAVVVGLLLGRQTAPTTSYEVNVPIVENGLYKGYYDGSGELVRHRHLSVGLQGETTEERIINFYMKYCDEALHDVDFIKASIIVSKEYGIDPTVAPAVMFADSGCGLQL